MATKVMTPHMAVCFVYGISPDLASSFVMDPTLRHSFPTHVNLLKRWYSGCFNICNVEHGVLVSHYNTLSRVPYICINWRPTLQDTKHHCTKGTACALVFLLDNLKVRTYVGLQLFTAMTMNISSCMLNIYLPTYLPACPLSPGRFQVLITLR
jgi:hypothetical protein